MNYSEKNKGKKKKKYYPKKKKYYPQKQQNNPPGIYGGFFNGNLAHGMNFGRGSQNLSGFVKREVFIKHPNGTIQRAKETQFFNSSDKPMEVRMDDKNNNGRF